MPSPTQCLEQLDKVLEAAEDPGAAYLIRSRLRRAMLSCVRMVAESAGQHPPRRLLGLRERESTMDDEGREVLRLCRRVQAIAEDLCQPSESFDVRWEKGWASLHEEIASLRAAVAKREMVSA
jgi:hypothetical protein